MKLKILFLFFALFSTGYLCAQKVKPVNYGGSVNLVKEIDANNVVIRALGYGKKEANAREDAEIRVMRAVLYVGFPGHNKMISEPESSVEAKHADFLSNFFEGKRYKDFITSVVSVGSLAKVKGQKVKSMPFDITVNLKALRQNLIENKVGEGLGFR